jgi:hypothetical protein
MMIAAVAFYHQVLGFDVYAGDFEFNDLQNESFCKDYGFIREGKCRLDCTGMKHPHLNIDNSRDLVLNDCNDELPRTHAIGGKDTDAVVTCLKSQPGVEMISSDPERTTNLFRWKGFSDSIDSFWAPASWLSWSSI